MELKCQSLIGFLITDQPGSELILVRYILKHIYNAKGNYLIGGKDISDFIVDDNKLLYGK